MAGVGDAAVSDDVRNGVGDGSVDGLCGGCRIVMLLVIYVGSDQISLV